jgi:LuxR family maltose regulon positive regulatory protein
MVLLARTRLARDDRAGAAELLKQAEQFMRQRASVRGMAEIAAEQVRYLLWPGPSPLADRLRQAADLVTRKYDIPLSLARVRLAQGDTDQALDTLACLRQQAEALDLPDERLKVAILQSLALGAHRDTEQALNVLGEALSWAEPGGMVRIFVDEGPPMARLLRQLYQRGVAVEYVTRILAAFEPMGDRRLVTGGKPPASSAVHRPSSPHGTPVLVERLSERELEVLLLIAEGLTNQEIASRLFLAVNTIKVHTRNINGKLGVHSRTKAVAKARDLGILNLS